MFMDLYMILTGWRFVLLENIGSFWIFYCYFIVNRVGISF